MYHGCQRRKLKELVLPHLNIYFEGTENIKRGEWFKIVTGNGGEQCQHY
jgi:hypothetical protein